MGLIKNDLVVQKSNTPDLCNKLTLWEKSIYNNEYFRLQLLSRFKMSLVNKNNGVQFIRINKEFQKVIF